MRGQRPAFRHENGARPRFHGGTTPVAGGLYREGPARIHRSQLRQQTAPQQHRVDHLAAIPQGEPLCRPGPRRRRTWSPSGAAPCRPPAHRHAALHRSLHAPAHHLVGIGIGQHQVEAHPGLAILLLKCFRSRASSDEVRAPVSSFILTATRRASAPLLDPAIAGLGRHRAAAQRPHHGCRHHSLAHLALSPCQSCTQMYHSQLPGQPDSGAQGSRLWTRCQQATIHAGHGA